MSDWQGGVDALERQVLAAHRLYLASLRHAEDIERKVRGGVQPFSESDLQIAEGDLGRSRTALRELLDALGYLPQGMVGTTAVVDTSCRTGGLN